MMKRTIELERRRDMVAQMEPEIHRLLAEIEADQGVLRQQKKQLESQLAGTPAFNSHDVTEEARCGVSLFATTQAAQEPRRQEPTADALDVLWRFSCEMPDAPHLKQRLNSTPIRHPASRIVGTQWRRRQPHFHPVSRREECLKSYDPVSHRRAKCARIILGENSSFLRQSLSNTRSES